MAKDYIEKRGTGYYVIGKRVTLEAIVFGFRDGNSPESILESYPTLSLEEIYGAISYYLANREAVDGYLTEVKSEFARQRDEHREKNPALYERLRGILESKRPVKT
jgi:uncharacterized protein (DUF433 family)